MNKHFIVTVLMLVSAVPAFAHLEEGEYQGKTSGGEACSMQVVGQHFENDVAHPLNERVQIRVGIDEFLVGHPAVVDASQSMAHFNHDLFQGVLPNSKGAKALVIEMVHSETENGPKSFHVISHEWRDDVRSAVHCQGLKHQR